jgi:hypothetical protein
VRQPPSFLRPPYDDALTARMTAWQSPPALVAGEQAAGEQQAGSQHGRLAARPARSTAGSQHGSTATAARRRRRGRGRTRRQAAARLVASFPRLPRGSERAVLLTRALLRGDGGGACNSAVDVPRAGRARQRCSRRRRLALLSMSDVGRGARDGGLLLLERRGAALLLRSRAARWSVSFFIFFKVSEERLWRVVACDGTLRSVLARLAWLRTRGSLVVVGDVVWDCWLGSLVWSRQCWLAPGARLAACASRASYCLRLACAASC